MRRTSDYVRFRVNWEDECNSALLYRALAEQDKNPKLAELYRRLAETEEGHACVWAKKLEATGTAVPHFRPSLRTRVLIRLARRFGAELILPLLSARETTATSGYRAQPEATGMAQTEQSHAYLLRQLAQTGREGVAGSALARFEGRHRAGRGNALRAAVLGASDGLLSNFNLIMGVAGAELSGRGILLTGCAGLLAGATSMALGEWISVRSSRELYERQIRTEAEEIAAAPEEETEELVLIYQARGIDEETARLFADRIMADRENAIETLAREELGINPEDLGGSAWEAAITSFLLFAAGAVIPVIPFLFVSGTAALAASAIASAIGLFLVGSAITLFTGRPILYSGARQVLFGLAAAGVTFLIGRLAGISLAN
jgi:VIT1/CCC1 family predicted Fe2+/Mn2+ transporter